MDTKAYLYRQEAMKRWILLFIVSLFSLFVLGTYAIAAERYYDESGRYMGRMDDSGRMYDKSGRYQGRVSEDGRFYDNSGRYQGRHATTTTAADIKAGFKTTTKISAKLRPFGALFFLPSNPIITRMISIYRPILCC